MMLFQSAPRCGHRGDHVLRARRNVDSSFNPRPGADTGATQATTRRAPSAIGFNPRPGADTGATCSSGSTT